MTQSAGACTHVLFAIAIHRHFHFMNHPNMIAIYHNPRCAKSRAGLEYLKNQGVDFEVIEYLKHPFTRESLKDLLMKLNLGPRDILRTGEAVYKEKFRGKNFTDEEWITILLENPNLIRRPIVVNGYKAVLAQPPNEIDRLLSDHAINQYCHS